jgi:large subunit ribosomal protein L19
METTNLIKKFGKQNVPDIRPGDTVKVSFKITEAGKTRIQIFEGIVIALKHGKGLDGTVKIRKIASGVGVERTFPLHSPLISKFEKVKSVDVRQSKLYFLRDLVGKKKKKKIEKKDYELWEESLSEEELAKIEEDKAKVAEEKQAKKAKQKAELDKKFEQAVASHTKEEK